MKTKSVLVKLQLQGKGIVNMDTNEQKWMFSKNNNNGVAHRLFSGHNNVNYAKKNFYRDPEGNLTYKIKMSSECIKKAMFESEYVAQTNNITHNDVILNSFIASPMSHIRGYMFPDKVATKRKGALTLSDAEQTNNAVSYLEVSSKSGGKTDESKSDDTSEANFYYHENVGDISYEATGSISLPALQFVSCDQIYDRYCFNPDHYPLYRKFMEQNFEGFDSDLGYFQMKGSSIDIPEYGYKMKDEHVVGLVKETLKKLLTTEVKRKNAFSSTSGLYIKLVNDPITDTMESETGWIRIETLSDIENLTFEVEEFYVETNLEESIRLRDEIVDAMKTSKKKKTAELQAIRDAKKNVKKDTTEA